MNFHERAPDSEEPRPSAAGEPGDRFLSPISDADLVLAEEKRAAGAGPPAGSPY